MSRWWLCLMLAACSTKVEEEPEPTPTPADTEDSDVPAEPLRVRVATFNASLFGPGAGRVATDLDWLGNTQAQGVASILQTVRPDVVLVNELDWDADGLAAARLHDNFLAAAQGDTEALDYPFIYVATSNTGVHSGLDLNQNGIVDPTPRSSNYGDDSWGFGEFEGQYAFAVFSRFPLGEARTFQDTLWSSMPDSLLPADFYGTEIGPVLRLSSKNHLDLIVQVGDAELHLLASHPTPPNFDGPEDRNGRRNHDEIRLWADYLDGAAWLVDDAGVAGGLQGEHFVVLGDLNADPVDGDSYPGAIDQLLNHTRVQDPAPMSAGAVEQAAAQGRVNDSHGGEAALDTTDFEDGTVGNLRLDYVLPSTSLTVVDSGVFWPESDEAAFAWVGTFPFPVSDHRLVWVDVDVPQD